jgi:hypothetical protein
MQQQFFQTAFQTLIFQHARGLICALMNHLIETPYQLMAKWGCPFVLKRGEACSAKPPSPLPQNNSNVHVRWKEEGGLAGVWLCAARGETNSRFQSEECRLSRLPSWLSVLPFLVFFIAIPFLAPNNR